MGEVISCDDSWVLSACEFLDVRQLQAQVDDFLKSVGSVLLDVFFFVFLEVDSDGSTFWACPT